ncbi:MAG: phosphoribosylformylglycinamidine synthase subunit PurQ [Planctomycetota bacterium]|nr:MAG: phosphoribosylformylglycinamidine synthase subunit PurQ [Planctomycetota bacterium]
MPRALVIRTAGTNCDAEMCRAFSLAGAEPELVHLDRLVAEPARLDAYDLIGLPGGFSYGDDVASGRIFAVKVRERLYPALRAAVERGVPIIGVCNGFQALVQCGLLPGPAKGEPWPRDRAPGQRLSLRDNASARFIDRWVRIRPEPDSVCVWTRSVAAVGGADDVLMLPIAHGEGRLVADSPQTIAELERAGQVALRYAEDVNGSEGRIAGVCDASGLVFGLMPHPERSLDWTRHPYWTRLPADVRRGVTPGLSIFRDAVGAASRVSV